MPVIIVKLENKKIGEYPIIIGQHCTIGRKGGNDIVIENLAVSGFHAQIDSVSTTFVVRDLGSTNGTFVNNKKILMHNLNNEDVIRVGKHELVFDCTDLLKMKANQSGLYNDAETRILNTDEFRSMIDEQKEKTVPDLSSEPKGFNDTDSEDRAFFSRLWRKIFG